MLTKKQEWLALITSLALLLTAALLFTFYTHSCSVEPKTQTVQEPAAPAPAPGTGTAASCTNPAGTSGATNPVPCPAGQTGGITQVCSNTGTWVTSTNTCAATPPPACTVPLYADVQPVFTQYCAECHNFGTSFADAQAAQGGPAEISRRVGLDPADPQHMPQGDSPQLSPAQISLIQTWVTDGANQTCPPPGGTTAATGTITEDYQITAANNDALNIPIQDRPFIRYLFAGAALNNGAAPLTATQATDLQSAPLLKAKTSVAPPVSATNLQTWVQAANKALNSLANEEATLTPIQPVDPTVGAVWRLDIRDYGIGAGEIAAIEAGDVNIGIIDNTSKGQALQALLGTSRPWYHLDNFLDITFRNSSVYYTVTNTPSTLAALQAQIGVNPVQSFQQLSANFIGSNLSPIAQAKNRLLVRLTQARDINNAYYWQTFDVNNLAGVLNVTGNTTAGSAVIVGILSTAGIFTGQSIADADNVFPAGTTVLTVNTANSITVSANATLAETADALTVTPHKNLFQDPLIAGTGGVELYNQDASEIIYQSLNGLQSYALVDANGNLLNAAATNVVIDTEAPAGVSNGGAIVNASSCTRCHNAGMIPMVDQVLAAVTGTNASHFTAGDLKLVKDLYQGAGSNAALFKADAANFATALAKLGIDPTQPDPQTTVTDAFLLPWNLQQLSSFLFITPAQATACINASATAQQQIGGLVSGGSATFGQLTTPIQVNGVTTTVLLQLIADCNLFQDPT